MAKKYYVVWEGRETGIFESWDKCKQHIDGFKGAKYKSFKSRDLAQQAFDAGSEGYIGQEVVDSGLSKEELEKIGKPIAQSIAVDAACSGNPGEMEYQGVFTFSKTVLFHQKCKLGTNNIGEFLALVHGLAYIKQHKLTYPLYSDSAIAIKWVKKKKCMSKLKRDVQTRELFDVVGRAEKWLKENDYSTPVLKWETRAWGEIPADFGRK